MFCKNISKKISFHLATGFGSGFLPAPGTAGSAVALLIWFLGLQHLPFWGQLIIVLLSIVIGAPIIKQATTQLKEHDCKHIVWDEFIGMWLTLLFIPQDNHTIYAPIIAFALFRFFDIIKPFPISWIDKKMQNQWGVILDDLLAAIFAGIILLLIINFVL